MVPLLLYCGWEGCGVCVEDGMEEEKIATATPLAGWIGRCQVSVLGIASKCIFPLRIALGVLLGYRDEWE